MNNDYDCGSGFKTNLRNCLRRNDSTHVNKLSTWFSWTPFIKPFLLRGNLTKVLLPCCGSFGNVVVKAEEIKFHRNLENRFLNYFCLKRCIWLLSTELKRCKRENEPNHSDFEYFNLNNSLSLMLGTTIRTVFPLVISGLWILVPHMQLYIMKSYLSVLQTSYYFVSVLVTNLNVMVKEVFCSVLFGFANVKCYYNKYQGITSFLE